MFILANMHPTKNADVPCTCFNQWSYLSPGDDNASIYSHSSTGYHSGVHSNTGIHSGIHSNTGSGINLASSSHTTPTHSIHHQPHYDHHSQLGDAIFNTSYVHHRQDYPLCPVGISSAVTTSNNSQYEYYQNSPKVGCPMAKVAPYSAQVNKSPVTLSSPRCLSTSSVSYQELAHRTTPSSALIQQQLKTPSSDGSVNSVEPTGSKWNGLIELKDRIMIQKDQLVERFACVLFCKRMTYTVQPLNNYSNQVHCLAAVQDMPYFVGCILNIHV